MSIDVFGRQLNPADHNCGPPGPPGIGFKYTNSGQFDLENKRLCNVGDAIKPTDAINLNSLKIYVANENKKFQDHLFSNIDKIISNCLQKYKIKIKSEIPEESTEEGDSKFYHTTSQ